MAEIVFAGGCFWGTEKLFSLIPGVVSTEVGYANGSDESHANYQDVCSGMFGFREAVRVEYDSSSISLNKLLTAFFRSVDPTMFNRQGFDFGVQYQTGIYWSDNISRDIIIAAVEEERKKYTEYYTEAQPLKCFCPAEEYHQKYLEKNPGGYCHISDTKIESILLSIK